MKFKIAIEMEVEIPDSRAEEFENNDFSFCCDFAHTATEEIADTCAGVGMGVNYQGFMYMKDNEDGYEEDILSTRFWRDILDAVDN